MPYANLSLGLDDAKRQSLLNQIASLETNMSYLVQLTTKEKKQHLRLGHLALPFVQKSVELATQNPQILPPYFNIDGFAHDVKDYEIMSDVLVQLNKVRQAVQDTVIALEQESIGAALDFYRHCQAASTQNVLGAQEAVRQLSPMISKKGQGKKKL